MNKAQSEALEQEGARSEARSLWRAAAEDIARKADVGILGYSQTEIDRIVRENDFGKGQRDMPYVGDDEYGDPMETGFEIANELFNQDEEICEEAAPDEPTSMDLYRNKSKSRKRNKNKESGK